MRLLQKVSQKSKDFQLLFLLQGPELQWLNPICSEPEVGLNWRPASAESFLLRKNENKWSSWQNAPATFRFTVALETAFRSARENLAAPPTSPRAIHGSAPWPSPSQSDQSPWPLGAIKPSALHPVGLEHLQGEELCLAVLLFHHPQSCGTASELSLILLSIRTWLFKQLTTALVCVLSLKSCDWQEPQTPSWNAQPSLDFLSNLCFIFDDSCSYGLLATAKYSVNCKLKGLERRKNEEEVTRCGMLLDSDKSQNWGISLM